MPVLDSERRKSHIDLINPTHTLLPTALGCLSYLEKDRPSAPGPLPTASCLQGGPSLHPATNPTTGTSKQGPTTAGQSEMHAHTAAGTSNQGPTTAG